MFTNSIKQTSYNLFHQSFSRIAFQSFVGRITPALVHRPKKPINIHYQYFRKNKKIKIFIGD